jgi:hypothetical protein
VFAGSTVYFANRLHDVRSRLAVELPSLAVATSADTRAEDEQAFGSSVEQQGSEVPARQEVSSVAAAAPGLPDRDWDRKVQQQVSARFMRRHDDPLQRTEMIMEAKGQILRGMRPFGRQAGMSDERLDALVTLLAQQRTERSVAEHRCGMDESCDYDAHRFPDVARQTAEIVALLGPETYQEYRLFRDAGTERGFVAALRTKLVDGDALRAADARRLVDALFEEREQYLAQAEQRGVQLTMITTGAAVVVARAGKQGGEPLIDDHSREFLDLMRKRAATILTQEQQRVFDEMQEEGYRIVAESIKRQKEIEEGRAAQAQANTRTAPR